MDDNKIDNSDTNNIKMKHCNTKTEIYNQKTKQRSENCTFSHTKLIEKSR